MTTPDIALVVRPCGIGDIARVRALLKLCWHSAYDPVLGPGEAARTGQRAYSWFNLGAVIAYSLLSRTPTVLVATEADTPVGYASAQRDGAEVILYGLYVHPDRKGHGIGSALLDAVIACHSGAKAIRLEVLSENAAAVSWYQAKGFEVYGRTPRATDTANVPALYMDRQL